MCVSNFAGLMGPPSKPSKSVRQNFRTARAPGLARQILVKVSRCSGPPTHTVVWPCPRHDDDHTCGPSCRRTSNAARIMSARRRKRSVIFSPVKIPDPGGPSVKLPSNFADPAGPPSNLSNFARKTGGLVKRLVSRQTRRQIFGAPWAPTTPLWR